MAQLKKRMEEKEAEIEELKKQLAERDGRIRQLDSTLVVLNEDLNNLASAKKRADQIATDQDEALNKGYYFIGNAKDLKNSGIVVKKGGSNKSKFTQIDIRDVTSFELKSKSAMVLTAHPKGSYKINLVDKNATLEIIDPAEFWRITRHLVVKIK